jgi:hypothetical protein
MELASTHRCVMAEAMPRPRRSLSDTYLGWLSIALLGYAVAGKGFAYLGSPPLYVGELTLVLGLLSALLTRTLLRVPRTSSTRLLLLYMAWGAVLTLADLPAYGVDALRDSVIWSYGIFALPVAGAVAARPARLVWMLRRYARFAGLFPLVIPGVWLLSAVYSEALPRLPGSDLPILYVKPGDILVHLAGISAFQLVGFGASSLRSLFLVCLAATLTAIRSRGGMLSFGLAFLLVSVAHPLRRRMWIAVGGALAATTLILSSNVEFEVAGRRLSGHQLIANAASIFASGHRGLEGTKQWRLEWWSRIVDDTLRGPHFWTGRGFGLNLAVADGFATSATAGLRSPHNAHLTVLSRAGAPGLALWMLLQGCWLREMLRAYAASRAAGQRRWSALFLFLVAYWAAFLANASFDVALEGPMAGVWFWTLFGLGIAAGRVRELAPWTLETEAGPSRPVSSLHPLPPAPAVRG